jgi:hypothetical protein
MSLAGGGHPARRPLGLECQPQWPTHGFVEAA